MFDWLDCCLMDEDCLEMFEKIYVIKLNFGFIIKYD